MSQLFGTTRNKKDPPVGSNRACILRMNLVGVSISCCLTPPSQTPSTPQVARRYPAQIVDYASSTVVPADAVPGPDDVTTAGRTVSSSQARRAANRRADRRPRLGSQPVPLRSCSHRVSRRPLRQMWLRHSESQFGGSGLQNCASGEPLTGPPQSAPGSSGPRLLGASIPSARRLPDDRCLSQTFDCCHLRDISFWEQLPSTSNF